MRDINKTSHKDLVLYFFSVSNMEAFKKKIFDNDLEKSKSIEYGGNLRPLLVKKAYQVLAQGYGDRVDEIYLKTDADAEVCYFLPIFTFWNKNMK